jgi:predicted DNA-binding transcriptional regulator
LELWWLGVIYSPQPPKKPLGRLLAMGAPDS